MKILHLINNLNKGGAERLLVDTLPYYKSKNIDISLLQLSDTFSEIKYVQKLRDAGIQVYSLSHGSVYNPLNVIKLRKFLKSNRFDLVHVHLFPAMYWCAIVKKMGINIPLIFTEHSNVNRRMNTPIFKMIDRTIYKEYNQIIAISPAIQQKLNTWVSNPDKIKLIRNGVDIDKFSAAVPYNQIEFEKQNGFPQGTKKILMAARFLYPKDHKTVVEALDFLPDNFIVLFAGDTGNIQDVKDFVKQKGYEKRVFFLGFRDDIPRLMKTVHINVLSSFYEGMSGVACEAMASGVPFLGTDVLGINDVVPTCEFLFEVENSKDLANKILRIVEDKDFAEAISKDALKHVQQFDVKYMIEHQITLYKNLLV